MGKSIPIQALIAKSQELERAGDVGGAFQSAREALERARSENDSEIIAPALVRMAYVEYRLGHYDQARALAKEALTHASTGAPVCADAWLIQGNCAAETVSLTDAEAFYHRAADLSRETGYALVRMRALHCLGQGVYMPRGQFDLALAANNEALRIVKKEDLHEWIYFPLVTLAWIHQLTGKPHIARKFLKELSLATKEVPDSLQRGYHDLLMGNLAQDEGDLQAARSLFMQARSIAESVGEPGLNIEIRLAMSRNDRLEGNASKARVWAHDALSFARRVGYRHQEGKALIELGRASWMGDDYVGAAAGFRAAMDVLIPLEAAFDLAAASFLLAALLDQQQMKNAGAAWKETANLIVNAGFAFLLERERALAFPLVAKYLNDDDPDLAMISSGLLERLSRVSPPPLFIHALGTFEVRQGTLEISDHAWRQRRAGELFRLLLVSPGRSLLRDQIVEALWPEKSPSSTRALLYQATSALRRALEPDLPGKFPSRYIAFDEGRVTLNLPHGSRVDFEEFEKHAKDGEWEASLALYLGELYPGDRYAGWAAVPCERLAQLAVRALVNVARNRLEAGHADSALDACRRAIAQEPWHEHAVLLGMQAMMALNDRTGAIRLYQDLKRHLRDELDTEPEETLRLFHQSLL